MLAAGAFVERAFYDIIAASSAQPDQFSNSTRARVIAICVKKKNNARINANTIPYVSWAFQTKKLTICGEGVLLNIDMQHIM